MNSTHQNKQKYWVNAQVCIYLVSTGGAVSDNITEENKEWSSGTISIRK